MPNKKYQIIYADPPWPYQKASEKWTWKDKHIWPLDKQYSQMTIEQISSLPIPSADDCWLVLWATVPKIQEAFSVLDAWGFNYRTMGIWNKGNGLGKFFRLYHEVILIGKKGKPPIPMYTAESIFNEGRKKHSQKPECVRQWIEKAFPNLSRIELFAREKVEGWDAWGNEIESDIEL